MKVAIFLAAVVAQAFAAAASCPINTRYIVPSAVPACVSTAANPGYNLTIVSTTPASDLTPCATPFPTTLCCFASTTSSSDTLSISCAAGYYASQNTSQAPQVCTGTSNAVFIQDNGITCLPYTTCTVTCTSVASGTCAISNGTSLATGTAVYNGTNVSCASGSYPANTVSSTTQTCSGTTPITVTCVGGSSSLYATAIPVFTTQALLLNYLWGIGAYYNSPGNVCNALCSTVGGTATQCTSTALFVCSQCFGSCVTSAVQRQSTGSVVVVCNQATTALRLACFRSAACAGLITPGTGCGLAGVGACPTCSSSKKGLLGLLGLLGIIPCVLCLSLLCLLLLCCIRRKKAARAVHFATFDAAGPALCPGSVLA